MEPVPADLSGAKVAFAGRLAGMSKRDATRLARQHGAVVLDAPDASATIIVLGGDVLPVSDRSGEHGLDELWPREVHAAAEAGRIEILTESRFWQRLGVVEADDHVRRLYTPGMLADLLGVSVAVVRRWQRRGLIRPAREVRRLAYFDFQEVATARRLAELLASGISPQRIESQLRSLGRVLPGVERPLAQLSAIVEGRDILLRQGDGLIDAGGQMRFDFDASRTTSPTSSTSEGESPSITGPPSLALRARVPVAADELLHNDLAHLDLVHLAEQYEDDDQLDAAEEAYRSALAAAPPRPEVCFQLAELLYRRGDLAAARERYYMAIELDADYVEARANLGCVLAELGQPELAAAAFEGALKYHGQYPDAHFHLARTLCDLSREAEAEPHWRAFLELAPESPWAEEARRQLAGR
jgi:tetratricopeptide (TPR) repeat protein